MCDAISVNGMRLVIDRAFAFDQAKAALAYMEGGAHFGKVAIKI
jgi:NADPH:quinone reductase-like Zn-dependent oxidoreductase